MLSVRAPHPSTAAAPRAGVSRAAGSRSSPRAAPPPTLAARRVASPPPSRRASLGRAQPTAGEPSPAAPATAAPSLNQPSPLLARAASASLRLVPLFSAAVLFRPALQSLAMWVLGLSSRVDQVAAFLLISSLAVGVLRFVLTWKATAAAAPPAPVVSQEMRDLASKSASEVGAAVSKEIVPHLIALKAAIEAHRDTVEDDMRRACGVLEQEGDRRYCELVEGERELAEVKALNADAKKQHSEMMKRLRAWTFTPPRKHE